MSTFPPNVILLATHDSYYVPEPLKAQLSDDMRRNNFRLLKNFSDFATGEIIKRFPNDQTVKAGFSRALGDPNRGPEDPMLFRTHDFNGNPIWTHPLRDDQQVELLKMYYHDYHRRVAEKIAILKSTYQRVYVLDVHDTGNLLLRSNPRDDSLRTPEFPPICLSNNLHKSCSESLLTRIAKVMHSKFSCEIQLNDPYLGGYVTTYYGNDPQVECVQIEFNRSMYMDEKTQELDIAKILKVAEKFHQVIIQICDVKSNY